MGQLASDGFNRADNASAGASWTTKRGDTTGAGGSGPSIVSNQAAVPSTGTDHLAYYNAVSWPTDGYAQATSVLAGASVKTMCVGYRMSTALDRTGYYGGYDGANFGDGIKRTFLWNGATQTAIANAASSVAANDVVRLQVSGSLVSLFINGADAGIGTSNATLSGAAGNNAGLDLTGSAINQDLADDFSGGDLLVASGVKRSARGLPAPGLRGPFAKAWMGRPRPQGDASTSTVANSALSAPGDSTATFVGAAQDNSVLSAAGDATATFTGASKAAAVLSAAGDATATFTGAAKAASVLSAAADATASFTGAAKANSTLSAPGDATASFTGAALDRGVLNAPGDSSLSFVGRSDAAAVWNAAADASAAWIGSTGGNVLSASGDSSGIFVGAELAAAVLAAAGDSSALWSGTFTVPGGDELGARAPMRGRAKARKPPKQRRPIYRHPEEVERERRMLAEYLESLETKARPASEEPVRPGESQDAPTRRAEPVAPRLSDVMARLASAQQLELIARAEPVAKEDRAKAKKEHQRRRVAAIAVLMMSH